MSEDSPDPVTSHSTTPIRWWERLVRGRDDATVTDSPSRDIAIGLGVVGAFLLIMIGWGAFARLDSGVYAQGQVVVFGNRQAVQHKDGGIVSELDVREGDRVKSGQILLRLSPDELKAGERAAADRVFQLEVLQARLLAEISGARSITPPAEFSTLTGADRISSDTAMTIQRREFATRAAALQTEKGVLVQREKQSSEQIEGYRRQLVANSREQVLIKDEEDGLQDLLKKGLVPLTRMRSLQRSEAELAGNQGEYNANVAKTGQQIGETRMQISDLDRQRAADVSKDFRDAQTELSEAQPKLTAIREQIDRTIVRAPATGRVVGLSIFTVGGVVAPGQRLMDIVPENQPLVIEARVKPAEADDLRIGQSTEIRISAFHDRGMPLLNGVVSKISADSITDEKTGAAYFKMEVTVPPSELKIIREHRGEDAGLKPGLPVEVVVPLKKRSALDYLVEPLRQMEWHSFRQR